MITLIIVCLDNFYDCENLCEQSRRRRNEEEKEKEEEENVEKINERTFCRFWNLKFDFLDVCFENVGCHGSSAVNDIDDNYLIKWFVIFPIDSLQMGILECGKDGSGLRDSLSKTSSINHVEREIKFMSSFWHWSLCSTVCWSAHRTAHINYSMHRNHVRPQRQLRKSFHKISEFSCQMSKKV